MFCNHLILGWNLELVHTAGTFCDEISIQDVIVIHVICIIINPCRYIQIRGTKKFGIEILNMSLWSLLHHKFADYHICRTKPEFLDVEVGFGGALPWRMQKLIFELCFSLRMRYRTLYMAFEIKALSCESCEDLRLAVRLFCIITKRWSGAKAFPLVRATDFPNFWAFLSMMSDHWWTVKLFA